MSMNLEKQTFSCEPEYLIAGPAEIVTGVKKASAALSKGDVVALDGNGELAKLTVTETPGQEGSSSTYATTTDNVYGILAEDAEADEDGIVYLSGEFFANKIIMPENADKSAVEIALRNLGIFLK